LSDKQKAPPPRDELLFEKPEPKQVKQPKADAKQADAKADPKSSLDANVDVKTDKKRKAEDVKVSKKKKK
jgi:hypothetical protein